jgi:hypothetical protein
MSDAPVAEPSAEELDQQDQDRLLLGYKVHTDRALKMMQLVSVNGLRRVMTAYLKAGFEDAGNLKREEAAMLNEMLAAHDLKYTLISKAIDAAKQQEEEKEQDA